MRHSTVLKKLSRNLLEAMYGWVNIPRARSRAMESRLARNDEFDWVLVAPLPGGAARVRQPRQRP